MGRAAAKRRQRSIRKTVFSDAVQLSTVFFKASANEIGIFKDPAMKTADSILDGMLKKIKREGVRKPIQHKEANSKQGHP